MQRGHRVTWFVLMMAVGAGCKGKSTEKEQAAPGTAAVVADAAVAVVPDAAEAAAPAPSGFLPAQLKENQGVVFAAEAGGTV